VARRNVRRLRAQPQRRREAASRRAWRRCQSPALRRDPAAPRIPLHRAVHVERARRGSERTRARRRTALYRRGPRAASARIR
jgi:hypothetical protein